MSKHMEKYPAVLNKCKQNDVKSLVFILFYVLLTNLEYREDVTMKYKSLIV